MSLLGLNVAYLIGGTLVIEKVFAINGLGALLFSSISSRDFPVVQGIALVLAFVVVLVSLVTDGLVALLDPQDQDRMNQRETSSRRQGSAQADSVGIATPRPSIRWLRRARRSRTLLAGSAILLVMLVLAMFVPAPYDPAAQSLTNGLAAPSAAHWFGTDQLGRDIFSRVIAATRTDLRIAVLAALTPFAVGVAVGLVSGYAGGWIDWLIGRCRRHLRGVPLLRPGDRRGVRRGHRRAGHLRGIRPGRLDQLRQSDPRQDPRAVP